MFRDLLQSLNAMNATLSATNTNISALIGRLDVLHTDMQALEAMADKQLLADLRVIGDDLVKLLKLFFPEAK